MQNDAPLVKERTERLAARFGLILVVIVMANNLPNIPGLLELVQSIPGFSGLDRVSKYETSFLFPLSFVIMMVVALLTNSFAKSWRHEARPKFYLGLLIDVMMLLASVGLGLVYLVEHSDVCLIDQLTGERARIIAEGAARAIEFEKLYGILSTAEVPDCQQTLGGWILPFLLAILLVFFVFIAKSWGVPIIMVAVIVLLYTVTSSAIWFFNLSGNSYLTTSVGTEIDGVRNMSGALIAARNAIIQESNGLLGQFLNIIVNIVFPYVVLGSLFGESAGGRSLIRLAIAATRRFRGGPAYAAVAGSAAFGSISGGPVVNVLGTGTLTIPMMQKAGYRPTFAGGVEAAASTGGQIVPPVMGIAAFVLAALSGVPYSQVVIAALLPATAYFTCLFLMVYFESRRENIQPLGKLSEEQRIKRRDWTNLVMVLGPIVLILILLLSKKDNVGTGFAGWMFGYDPASGNPLPWLLKVFKNGTGDPDSAGFWAAILLIGLLFLDPVIRKNPRRIFNALSNAGILVSKMYLLLIAVSVIDICNNFSNFTGMLTIDVLNWLKGAEVFSIFNQEFNIDGPLYLSLVLIVTMIITILLGMGMPTLPAYVNVVLILGPLLVGLGTSIFTAHMFIFYYAVASAITPPVAIAAYAASTISKADPVATGFSAVRAGAVVFIIPFVFAFYPELLLIEHAQLAPSLEGGGGRSYLAGYDGTIDIVSLGWLLLRLSLALYLLASALVGYDSQLLTPFWRAARLVLAVLILLKLTMISVPAIAISVALIAVGKLKTPNDPRIGTPLPFDSSN